MLWGMAREDEDVGQVRIAVHEPAEQVMITMRCRVYPTPCACRKQVMMLGTGNLTSLITL